MFPPVGSCRLSVCNIMKEMIELEEEQNKAWLGVSKSRAVPSVAGGIGVPTEESADESSIRRVRDVSRINKRVKIVPQFCNSYPASIRVATIRKRWPSRSRQSSSPTSTIRSWLRRSIRSGRSARLKEWRQKLRRRPARR